MISEVLNAAADENKFYNSGKLQMFFALKVLDYYTNISFTEKQKENPINAGSLRDLRPSGRQVVAVPAPAQPDG